MGLQLAGYFSKAEFESVLDAFLASLLKPLVEPLAPGELFLEKTPSNAVYLGEITKRLPASRFIHMLRDPRDVVASLLEASRAGKAPWAPTNVRDAVRMWRRYLRRVNEVKPSLPDWQFLEVRYEELHADPHRVLADCARFLGLQWSDEDIRSAIAANESSKARASNESFPVQADRAQPQANRGATFRPPSGFVRNAKVGSWNRDLGVFEKVWMWLRLRKDMSANGYRW